MLQIHDALHILRSQRFKIQLIRNIKVCADSLRIVIDDDRLIAFFGKSPGTVYGTEVKLDSLADPDRSGTKDQHLLLSCGLFHLIFTAVYRIIVRCLRRKFRRAGVHHLICRADSVFMAHIVDLSLGIAGQSSDYAVREFHPLRFS